MLPNSPPVPGAREYAWLALGFLAVAVYGSLIPFHFQPLPLGEALVRFREVCSQPVRVESRSDWAANILLFIPLGFLLMAALCVDRPRVAALAALGVVPFCTALSAALEFAQLYFPPRVSSLNDIVAESVGGLAGVLAWLVLGRPVTRQARLFWSGVGRHGRAARLLPAYLVFLVVVHALPFDLTLSPIEIYHKYRAGRVHLIPFAPGTGGALEQLQKQLWNLAYFFPVGLLLGALPGRSWRDPKDWPRVLGLGLAVAGLIEFMQLFVVSRSFNTTDILSGGLAVWGGWAAALAWSRPGSRLASSFAVRFALLAGWLAVAVFLNWQPFDFTTDPAVIPARVRQISPVPFVDYYQGNYLNALDQILNKVFLFLPLGALLTPLGPVSTRARAALAAVLAAAAVAAALEAGQIFLPSRFPSVSDVLVETFGAWLGYRVTGRVRSLAGEGGGAEAAGRG